MLLEGASLAFEWGLEGVQGLVELFSAINGICHFGQRPKPPKVGKIMTQHL